MSVSEVQPVRVPPSMLALVTPFGVTVSQDYPITVPFIGSILTVPGNQLNLRATIRDTILQPYKSSCPAPVTPYPFE